ncbi:hypothetical protein NC653_039645 [Populus alba x Populus x berolinensis]|uniref:Uncharacterized protein n=1 Tax=Populus alba x Populus x berolinensis TaxID=444605 RepID=A0AAD6LBP0_9ROSI|nr:hypothetical protein NC653_039645 [Populus alba x Populus x berolinensis]
MRLIFRRILDDDGKPFNLAYLFLKHMNNVIKEKQMRALMYGFILIKILIIFDVNVLDYKDDLNIGRDDNYNTAKLKELRMICVDETWIYDPSKEHSARKLELGPRQRSSIINQQHMPLHQPQSTFEEGSSSVPLITLQSIHDM